MVNIIMQILVNYLRENMKMESLMGKLFGFGKMGINALHVISKITRLMVLVIGIQKMVNSFMKILKYFIHTIILDNF